MSESWIRHRIIQGRIEVERHERYGCYLFPKEPSTLEKLERLKKGESSNASFRKGH